MPGGTLGSLLRYSVQNFAPKFCTVYQRLFGDMDTLTAQARSALMSKIRAQHTKPELLVRRLVTALGFRYRLHRSDLPGRPDLAFIGRRKVIFVHGCFWHLHASSHCWICRLPKSRRDY